VKREANNSSHTPARHASRVTLHDTEGLRVDKWLWFARFFKSRSQATDAVTGGLVHVNHERAKAARAIRAGDTLTITRGDNQFEVLVVSLPTRRGPAAEAQAAYRETEESAARRAKKQEQLRIAAPAPDGKPDKYDRRALRNLRDRNR
jgi:ribosome-associated heat shock protein Hsp15